MSRRSRNHNMKKVVIVGGTAATTALCSAGIAFAASGPFVGDHFALPNGGYFSPSGDLAITGLYGMNTGQPGESGQFQGEQVFMVHDSDGTPLGSFNGLVGYNFTDANPHMQIFVDRVLSGDSTLNGGVLPPVGSVFNYGGTNPIDPTYYYTSLPGYDVGKPVPDVGTGDQVFSSSNSTFDASAHVDVHSASPGGIALPDGHYLVADPESPENYTGISNGAPFASTVQGTQVYDVMSSNEAGATLLGKVNAITIGTADFAGGNSREIFVTGYPDDVGTATDQSGVQDYLTQGSVINYLNYFGLGNSVYYDFHATGTDGANEISQAWNMFGIPFTTTPSFDAVKGFSDGTDLFQSIPIGNGMTIVPTGGPVEYTPTVDGNYYTGINGIPNGGVSGTNTVVQSFQHFDITGTDESGTSFTDPFTAYVTTYSNGNITDQTMYITGYDDPSGTLKGLPVGSTVEYADHGWYDTLVTNTDPTGLGSGANEVTRLLSIPLLGMENLNIDPSLNFWLGLIGIDF